MDGAATRPIAGLNIWAGSLQAAIAAVLDDARSGETRLVGFCNAHTVNLARKDPAFRQALGRMRLFNDGAGLDIASRLRHGAPFPANLNGTDLTPLILAALDESLPVFLLGSRAGVAERAASALIERFPRLRIVGNHHGFFAREEEPALGEMIRDSGARLVLVGMGQPAQEFWAVRNADPLAATLLCVGAFIDFAAGTVRRAPPWMRRSKLEWLFRLAQEPRRMARRYLVGNITFLWQALRRAD